MLVEMNWQPMLYEPHSPGEYRRRLVSETGTEQTLDKAHLSAENEHDLEQFLHNAG
jgi:hypothetical protein